MALTRPIQREPRSSDERQELALWRQRLSSVMVTPAAATVSNRDGDAMAGTRVSGSATLKGGNPGPIGT